MADMLKAAHSGQICQVARIMLSLKGTSQGQSEGQRAAAQQTTALQPLGKRAFLGRFVHHPLERRPHAARVGHRMRHAWMTESEVQRQQMAPSERLRCCVQREVATARQL